MQRVIANAVPGEDSSHAVVGVADGDTVVATRHAQSV